MWKLDSISNNLAEMRKALLAGHTVTLEDQSPNWVTVTTESVAQWRLQ